MKSEKTKFNFWQIMDQSLCSILR